MTKLNKNLYNINNDLTTNKPFSQTCMTYYLLFITSTRQTDQFHSGLDQTTQKSMRCVKYWR